MAVGISNSAMVLTPKPGAAGAAIAVVRIRGPRVPDFLARCFSKIARAGKCVHGELRDNGEIIDDPVVVISDAGDWADICLHGGPWIVASTLELCRREGFSILETKIGLPVEALDDATDVWEREMLMHLPQALTPPALRMLLNQPTLWREAIKGPLDAAAILEDQTLWRLLHPPQIAIVGEPNVGKSTLANWLFGAERSITANVPGTTRDWVGEMADIAGMPALLLDTPGHRETDDAIERAAIVASEKKIAQSDLIIIVLDATRQPQILLPVTGKKITVVNKIDQPVAWDFHAANAVEISAKTGHGIDKLHSAIHREMGITDWDEHRLRWWTDPQRVLLEKTRAGQ
jgi:small GTP-binding protein